MSRSGRFELQRVEDQGRKVAVIFDHATGKTHKIHRRGSRFLRWDANDVRVENAALRKLAREALA